MFLVSCSKDSVQPDTADTSIIAASQVENSSKLPTLDCCDCRLYVNSSDSTVPGSFFETWAVSVSYEGDECDDTDFFIVGGPSVVNPIANPYNTPGQVQIYPFQTNYTPSVCTLRTYVGSTYASFPIEIEAWIICGAPDASDPTYTLPMVTLDCESASGGACSGNASEAPEVMEVTIDDCLASGPSGTGGIGG